MKEIQLTKGKTCLVDECDYVALVEYSWYCTSHNYAAGTVNGNHIYMHRFLAQAPKSRQVDHINGDTLDNRRANLRLCTHKQNIRNMKKKPGSSKFRGVSVRGCGWIAKITVDRKQLYLGTFTDEEDAAKAYDVAAEKYFAEFARRNCK